MKPVPFATMTRMLREGILLLLSLASVSMADSVTTPDPIVGFDLLLPTGCPASMLLGIEPTQVDRPGSPADLAVSVLGAPQDLAQIPSRYALEVTPYWFIKKYGASNYMAKTGKDVFLQTLSLSVGTSHDSDTTDSDTTSIALGLRFSLWRGKPTSDFEREIKPLVENLSFRHRLEVFIRDSLGKQDSLVMFLDTLKEKVSAMELKSKIYGLIMERKVELYQKFLPEISSDSTKQKEWLSGYCQDQDSTVKFLKEVKRNPRGFGLNTSDTIRINQLIEERLKEENSAISQCVEHSKGLIVASEDSLLQRIEDITGKYRFNRIGFKLSFAAGGVAAFPSNQAANFQLNRIGAWVTSGWEEPSWSALLTSRFWYNLDGTAPSSFDIIGRALITQTMQISFSVEGGIRIPVFDPNTNIDWRSVIVADCPLWKNNLVSISIGKDFRDGTGSNIVSSIAFKQGFGSKRPIN